VGFLAELLVLFELGVESFVFVLDVQVCAEVGVAGAVFGLVPDLFAAEALRLSERYLGEVVGDLFAVSDAMLLLETAYGVVVPLAAAPPHVVSVCAAVDAAAPVIIFLFAEVLLAIHAKFGVYVDNFSVFKFDQFTFKCISFLGCRLVLFCQLI